MMCSMERRGVSAGNIETNRGISFCTPGRAAENIPAMLFLRVWAALFLFHACVYYTFSFFRLSEMDYDVPGRYGVRYSIGESYVLV
jgi:hypothetical protein